MIRSASQKEKAAGGDNEVDIKSRWRRGNYHIRQKRRKVSKWERSKTRGKRMTRKERRSSKGKKRGQIKSKNRKDPAERQ